MSSDEAPDAAADLASPWSRREVWMLGALGVVGLAGFIAAFILLVARGPDSNMPSSRALTAAGAQNLAGLPGERGPPGPAGPRGAAGDAAIRVLRSDCATGNCTVECADDEVLLNAYCGPNRTPAAYPAEHSALCRATGRGRIEVVAACLKSRR